MYDLCLRHFKFQTLLLPRVASCLKMCLKTPEIFQRIPPLDIPKKQNQNAQAPPGGRNWSLTPSWRLGIEEKIPGLGWKQLVLLIPPSHHLLRWFKSSRTASQTDSCTPVRSHSRISYEKVRPDFVHAAARSSPSPQELLQLQHAGARCGFRFFPQFWDGGLSHEPACPPHRRCGHSSWLSCVISPSQRLAVTGGDKVTQQVPGASKESKTYFS